MVGHLRELRACQSIHEAGLTDTVTTHETVLAAVSQFEVCSLKQGFSSYDQADIIENEVVVFARPLPNALDLHGWQLVLLLLDLLHVFLEVDDGLLHLLVFPLLLLLPFHHLVVTVSSSGLLGEKRLSGIIH